MFTVTCWKNTSGFRRAFYGLRVKKEDRERYFRPEWKTVHLHLPDPYGSIDVQISPSFWRLCPELRSKEIGDWLRDIRAAPWKPRQPPRFTLRPSGSASFEVTNA